MITYFSYISIRTVPKYSETVLRSGTTQHTECTRLDHSQTVLEDIPTELNHESTVSCS